MANLQIGSYYVIAYEDGDGKRSRRVVRYEGPKKQMYDCGKKDWRDFKLERIKKLKQIPSSDVKKAVARFYK